MPYTCEKCGSEVIIKIIKQFVIVKDNLKCPFCGGNLKPDSVIHAVFGT